MAGTKVSRGMLLRDLLIFQIKLVLDGLKDVALLQASLAAAAADILLIRHTRGRCFYAVLRLSERIDLWLNLHGAAQLTQREGGLFEASEAGSPTFLGKLEAWVEEAKRAHETPVGRPAQQSA